MLCLDRACEYQEIYPHYAHVKDADFLSIEIATTGINKDLESLKAERGRRCINCARWLIPTDGDHSFCNDCWDEMMKHQFIDYGDGRCENCGERKWNKMHN